MMPTIPATNGHDSWSNPGPGRAINVSLDRAAVEALCTKNQTKISAIEALPDGGTRVVMMNGEDAVKMRHAFGNKILTGIVARQHWARVVR
ncbi:hypothetical protein [Sphingomonas sp.]|uniref:hypothetical protein n=1 Tax=Sphingomonas sp. TaxID=28214 RepID=UPI00260141F7|nr:hypothetical protein [Sphingomonas sp.]